MLISLITEKKSECYVANYLLAISKLAADSMLRLHYSAFLMLLILFYKLDRVYMFCWLQYIST